MKNIVKSIFCFAALNMYASEFVITPSSFGPAQKVYVGYAVSLWAQISKKSNITTGLAGIFNYWQGKELDSLFDNVGGLAYANDFLSQFNQDEAIQAFSALQKIANYQINDAQSFANQTIWAIRLAKTADVLKRLIPESVTPSGSASDLYNAYGLVGNAAVPYEITMLKMNESIPETENNKLIILGMVLAAPFLPGIENMPTINSAH